MSYESIVQEHLIIRRNLRMVAVGALLLLVLGAVFYHIFEQLAWLDAFYFCTITLTTVGYGDITPHTPQGKLFTMFYVLIGVGVIATFANLLLKNAVIKREIKKAHTASTAKTTQ